MPYSTSAKNIMLQALADVAAWVTLHTATTLTSGAAAGANQIAVVDPVAVGSAVRLNPGEPTEETATVGAVAGAGPYTLTLVADLTDAHDAGEYVSYDPNATLGPKEPSGGDPAFDRLPITWNAVTGGNLDSSNTPDFDIPPSTPVTHFVIMEADTGINIFAWAEMPLTMVTGQSTFRLRDADLTL